MAQRFFGFEIEKEQPPARQQVRSPIPPENNEGGYDLYTNWGNLVGNYARNDSLNGQSLQNENLLINKYREIAMSPEADMAIEEIVSDAIISDESKQPVELRLDGLDISDQLKEQIQAEFDNVLNLLNFKTQGHDIFRRWYVDGRINYHKVVDEKNLAAGIQELRYIDPKKIKKVREILPASNPNLSKQQQDEFAIFNHQYKEYWIYSERGYDSGQSSVVYYTGSGTLDGIRIAKDAVAHSNSGIKDVSGRMILSHLHKALRVHSQLRMLEDAIVIYAMVRAPERRVFYIDVGNLPRNKADQFLREIMTKFKSKLVYNSETGEIRDDRRHLAMTEDFWLPRRADGNRGTQIDTLKGGEGLIKDEKLEYYLNKLYRALNVPIGRIDTSQAVLNFGKGNTEVSREELKFAKFVARLRSQFNTLFDDLLSTQLALKGIVSVEDWSVIRQFIQYEYARDNHFKEIRDTEILRMRLETLELVKGWMGVFYDPVWVGNEILKLSEDDLKRVLTNAPAVAAAGGIDALKAYGANTVAASGAEFQMQLQIEASEAQAAASNTARNGPDGKMESLQAPGEPSGSRQFVTGSPSPPLLEQAEMERSIANFLKSLTPSED